MLICSKLCTFMRIQIMENLNNLFKEQILIRPN
jgi:hypothetical protein